MRYAVIAVLAAVAVPAQALWVEVDTLDTPCRAAGLNVTFTAGDLLPDGRNGWVAGTYHAEGGDRIAILRTTDGRRSWTATWTEIDRTPATAIDFVDANHGWLLAGTREIYRTDDGGRTWESEEIIGGSWALRNLKMIDATHGFVSGAVFDRRAIVIMAYDAAERNWELVGRDPRGSLVALAALAPASAWGAGLTAEGTHIARRWQVGDAEWHEMSIPSSVQALSFVSDRRGYAACTAGRVFATADGGATWREKETPVLADLSDVRFTSPSEGVALSEDDGLLLVTTARGDSWAVERTPDGAHTLLWDGTKHLVLTPTGLHIREELRRLRPAEELRPALQGPQLAEVVAGPFSIAHTWREATELSDLLEGDRSGLHVRGGYHISCGSFLDDGRHGWFVGSASSRLRTVLRTANGGQTWEMFNPRDDLPMSPQGVEFVDPDNGWMWGDPPLICRTRDGGETWVTERMSGPQTANVRVVRELSMFDEENGLAIADVTDSEEDLLLRRTPGTGVWQAHTTVSNFAKLATLPPDYMWLGSSTMTVAAGTEPAHLTPLMPDTWNREAILKLMLHNRNVGWLLLTQSTHIMRTSDGGGTWAAKHFASDVANYAVDADIIGANQCYVLTRLGRVLRSGDGGDTWDEVLRLPSEVEPYRATIHTFGAHVYVCAGNALWTTVPPRGPAQIRDDIEPYRPVMADRLLGWSEESAWSGNGVSHSRGMVGQETVFRVRWDPRNAKAPGQLMLQMRLPAAAGPLPLLARLRPAEWWATHETGKGDWGVGFTPSVAGSYEYRFFGTNEDGAEVIGEPTEWRTWTVE